MREIKSITMTVNYPIILLIFIPAGRHHKLVVEVMLMLHAVTYPYQTWKITYPVSEDNRMDVLPQYKLSWLSACFKRNRAMSRL